MPQRVPGKRRDANGRARSFPTESGAELPPLIERYARTVTADRADANGDR